MIKSTHRMLKKEEARLIIQNDNILKGIKKMLFMVRILTKQD